MYILKPTQDKGSTLTFAGINAIKAHFQYTHILNARTVTMMMSKATEDEGEEKFIKKIEEDENEDGDANFKMAKWKMLIIIIKCMCVYIR